MSKILSHVLQVVKTIVNLFIIWHNSSILRDTHYQNEVTYLSEKQLIEKAPAYVQVYNNLYVDITSGYYKEGQRLPNENALAEHYGVSRSTLRQALAILNEDRLIAKSQGKGTIVTPKKEFSSFTLTSQQNPAISLAIHPINTNSTTYNYGPPTDIAKTKLELGNSDVVLALTNVYLHDEKPVSYAFFQLPVRYFEDLSLDLTDEQIFDDLISHMLFSRALTSNLSIKAISAHEQDAALLNVEKGRPLQLLEFIFYNRKQEPFGRCKMYLISDYYQLNLSL